MTVPAHLPRLLLPLGLLLVVLGAKFGLLQYAGSDVPYHDQWGAEGSVVYRWHLRGEMGTSYLFWSHGEHTPALTRALGLGLFVLNSNQWDAFVEGTACVLLYGFVVCMLWRFARDVLGERALALAAVIAAVLFSQPVCSENFVWGFQTQFHFLMLFSLAHMYGVLREERLGLSWGVGQMAGALALFSMASGLVSAGVLAGLACTRLRAEPRNRWAWATLGVNAVLVAIGLWLVQRAEVNAGTKAGSVVDFLRGLGWLLSWPLPGPVWLLVVQLPLGWALCRAGLRRERAARLLMALGAWTWLSAAALAYGRGSSSSMIAGRYLDLLVVGLFANSLALGWLWLQGGLSRFARTVLLASLAAQLGGVAWQNRPEVIRAGLDGFRHEQARQKAVLQEFLASDDPAVLERDPVVRRVLPHLQLTIELLRDPLMRRALPPSIVPGLVLSPRGGADRAIRLQPGQHYESQPVAAAGRPIWRLQVKGLFGGGEGDIHLVASDGRKFRSDSGDITAPEGTRTIHLPAPSLQARVVARAGRRSPLEFTGPVELGYLSWYAPKLARIWAGLLGIGGAVLLAGVGAAWFVRDPAKQAAAG